MRVSRIGAMACALVAFGFFAERRAAAQTTPNALGPNNGSGLDSHLFRPAMDSKGLFSTNGSEIIGKGDVSFGFIIDYGRDLLRVTNGGQKSQQLVNDSFQGTGQFNYGVFSKQIGLLVGIDVPVNLMAGDQQVNQAGAALFANQWSGNQLDSQTFGFLAAHAKLRLTRVDDGVGLAVGLQVGAPVSDAPKNAGADPSFWYWPTFIAERRFGKYDEFKLAANVGYRGHSASGTVLTLKDGTYKDGSLLTYGGGLSIRVLSSVDVIAETYGTYLLNDSDAGVAMSNEAVAGVKLFVEKNSYLMLGAGPRYTTGFEAADFRGFIGFIFEPSIGDRDGDGIKDDVDQCPDQAEDMDHFKDEDGCPDPDNDNDGIPDVDDRCPNVPEDRDGDHDEDGCPEFTDGDRDGDGVPDSKDACPDVPGIKTNDPATNGCPPKPPPPADRDHDGIPDAEDACPDVPGVPDKDPKKNGCPPEQHGPIKIENNQLVAFEKVKFATASSAILPESNKLLDDIATTVKNHPDFLLFEIAGHADERGPELYNLQLTSARVASVVQALIMRGVDSSRLRSKGYGLYCPEDLGHNEAAWDKNRRVEFKIVKTKDGPTGVDLGCPNAVAHNVKPDPIP